MKKIISKNKVYYVGVDVGGMSIKYGIFNEKKKLIDEFSKVTTLAKTDNEKKIAKDMLDSIEGYFKDKKIDKYKIKGIGFAIPGPVVNNKIIKAININWKKQYDLVKATKKRFGKDVKVLVYNDANAATIGEYNYSLKGKYKSICLITLGTGIGTGIIINGELVEGKSGIAGELAHIRVDYSKDAVKCNCGNTGCLETVASCIGLINVYNRLTRVSDDVGASNASPAEKEKIAKISRSGKIEEAITAKHIIDNAKKGDKVSLEALNTSLNYLSRLIVILIHVYEPEVVLIGGGMSNAGTFITKIINKRLKEKVYMTKVLPKIVIAKLKNKAGIYGAVENL